MERAGEFLKAERLKKNKTLKEIAQSTRISSFTLDALETDKAELLPPAAYVRGFIKAYADELDINPEEVLALYDNQVHAEHTAPQSKEVKHRIRRLPLPGYAVPVIAGAVLLLVCALYFGYKGRNAVPAVMPQAGNEADVPTLVQPLEPAPSQEPEMAPFLEPAAAQKAGADTPSAAAVHSPFTVRFVAGERSWMRFTVDDRHVFEVLLKPGDSYSVNAVSGIKVRIGNPAGLTAFYNNSPVPVPGRRGTPVDMIFPEAGQSQPFSLH